MLNRRVLRIKGMQTLFGYYQAKEANVLLAQDYISEKLQPNLNLDVPENKIEMAEKEKEALELFSKWVKDQNQVIECDDRRVEDVVNEASELYQKLVKSDFENISKRMLIEIENLYSLYFLCIKFLLEIKELNLNNNINKNTVLINFIDNEAIQTELTKHNSNWVNEKSLLKKLNKETIIENENIKEYISLENPTIEEDRKILNEILKITIFGNDDLIEFFERRDLYWIENKNVLKSMLKKTIKDSSNKEVLKISPNWEDDKVFFKDLFRSTIENEEFVDKFISKQSKNWEKDRFALTDLIILKMGITEMISFSNIPIKVTINEYIEISKSYSTPKSKQFINGMLDKASLVLQKEGEIKKSGRGLIDNK